MLGNKRKTKEIINIALLCQMITWFCFCFSVGAYIFHFGARGSVFKCVKLKLISFHIFLSIIQWKK